MDKMPSNVQTKNLAAPIISGATGLASNLANVYMQNQTNRTNQSIARENNAWNREMWNTQTQYNTPANQMQRLKNAGLNTSLMYGQPQNVAGTPPTSDTNNKAQAPRVELDQVASNALQAYNQQRLTEAQVNNVNKDTEGKEISNIKSAVGLPFEYQKQFLGVKQQEATIDSTLKTIEYQSAQIANIKQETLNKELEGQQLAANINYLEKTMKARIQTTTNQWAISKNNVKLSEQEVKNSKLQATLIASQVLTEATKRQDISERLQLFKEFTQEEISSIQMSNQKQGIDLANYQKMRGTPEHQTTYGLVMKYVDDILGSVGQVLSGSMNFSPGTKKTNIHNTYQRIK